MYEPRDDDWVRQQFVRKNYPGLTEKRINTLGLWFSVYSQLPDSVMHFYNKGGEIDVSVDSEGTLSPLPLAIYQHDLPMIELLIGLGASTNIGQNANLEEYEVLWMIQEESRPGVPSYESMYLANLGELEYIPAYILAVDAARPDNHDDFLIYKYLLDHDEEYQNIIAETDIDELDDDEMAETSWHARSLWRECDRKGRDSRRRREM